MGLPRIHEPFEIEASELAWTALRTDVVEVSFDDRFGSVWLRDRLGNIFALNVQSRDVEPMFEVFSLEMTVLEDLVQRTLEIRSQAETRDGLPERLRAAWASAPLPNPPASFEPWPFNAWRVQILRRAEFIVEDVEVEGALGQGPHNSQSAAKPGHTPFEAAAICEVAAGLLFTGSDESRLLIAVDWQPFAKIISRDPEEIEQFLETCEAVETNPGSSSIH